MTRRNFVDRTRPLWRLGNRWEVMLLRRFGTSGMAVLGRQQLLVIETRGRKTGRRRAAPIAFWREGDEFYVGGGAAGMTRPPDWVANLRADPHAHVVVRRQRLAVHAEELAGTAYDAAHAHALSVWKSVPKYERRSGRRVPYFRLTAEPG
jgi:deazaflavin-dependent oxidoreductase (nitroreductase family)